MSVYDITPFHVGCGDLLAQGGRVADGAVRSTDTAERQGLIEEAMIWRSQALELEAKARLDGVVIPLKDGPPESEPR